MSIPLTLLTGFLGSGKTTLLNSLMKNPKFSNTAVLINEFGAIGLDHHLVDTAVDIIKVVDGGCMCCTVRGEVSDTLKALYWERQNGKVPAFDRVILETTGLANPAPLLQEILKQSAVLQHYRLAGVVVCVDGVLGLRQLDSQPEAAQQAAVADRLLVTKTDLITMEARDALLERLRHINPGAEIVLIDKGQAQGDVLDDRATFDPLSKQLDVQQWLKPESFRRVETQQGPQLSRLLPSVQINNPHDAEIKAVTLSFEQPLALGALIAALEVIMPQCGENMLRLKGIVDIEGRELPMVIHGVRDMLFPTGTLEAWPAGLRQTHLVFILRNTEAKFITDTLSEFIHVPAQAGRSIA